MGEVLHMDGLVAAGGLAMGAGLWVGAWRVRRALRAVLDEHAMALARRSLASKVAATRQECDAQRASLHVLENALKDRGLI